VKNLDPNHLISRWSPSQGSSSSSWQI